MRISDWSSDVCSSDLSYVPGGDANPAARADFHCPSFLRSYVDKSGNTHGRGLLQFAKPRKLHGSAVIRINLHIIGRLEKHTAFRCDAVELSLAAPLGIQSIFDLPLTARMTPADATRAPQARLDTE